MVPEMLSERLQGQNYFQSYEATFSFLYCVNICAHSEKVMMDKIAGVSTTNKAPMSTNSLVFFTTMHSQKKIKSFSL